jgi:hypothetical protein
LTDDFESACVVVIVRWLVEERSVSGTGGIAEDGGEVVASHYREGRKR